MRSFEENGWGTAVTTSALIQIRRTTLCSHSLHQFHLGLVQPGVRAPFVQQLRVLADFRDFPRSTTTSRFAFRSVLSRCAMANVVRAANEVIERDLNFAPRFLCRPPRWLRRGSKFGGRSAAPVRWEMRCRSPPESDWPRSPTSES